jgi:hypothetical protein
LARGSGPFSASRTAAKSRTFARIERGFDFLAYHLSRAGLTAAMQTFLNFAVVGWMKQAKSTASVFAVAAGSHPAAIITS